jgi:1-acyl-sn-glycerol-3-phosphate acyltransferase
VRPVSGCGRGCLPRPGAVAPAALVLRIGRLFALLLVLLGGFGVVALLPLLEPAGRSRLTRSWFRGVIRASGVRLSTADSGLGAGTLVTANHVSWLDIPTVLAIEPMRVLAKSDVRAWPVIGLLAARAGTIFIDRHRLRRLPDTVAEIAGALRGGQSVLVFPEGTTWCGRTLGRFYPATLQAAVDAGAPVRPVALRYVLGDGTVTTAAAFIGADTLLASVWRVVSARGLTVELTAAPLVEPAGLDRRELTSEIAARIKGRSVPVPHWP